uniref:FYVE-type domain-containing protein n=1 Tax=Globisporangium ultimum (strain ATCC 200006 / CBS 805.95 / DAOM BR144) TaxID=431595 RepID=K3W694_GLOUD
MTKRFANPFPALALTSEDARQLEGLAHAFIRSSMDQFEQFALRNKSNVDDARWKYVTERENVRVFSERREKDRHGKDRESDEDAPVLNAADLPVVLVTGTIEGKLDDAIYGYVCPDLDTMRIKTSYIDDALVGSAVLASLIKPTPADPFRSLSIKWIEKGRPIHVRAVAKNRDFVYMESTGTDVLSNGERIGYHLIHSVQFPQTPELDTVVRGNMSVSGIFRQKTDNTVEIYIKGVMNPAGGLMRSIIIKSAAQALVSSWKYMHCAEMKKLAWLMRQRTLSGPVPSSKKDEDDDDSSMVRSCAVCGKKPSAFSVLRSRSHSKSKCKICRRCLCSSCKTKKTLSFIAKDLRLVQQDMTFCEACVREAASISAVAIAKDEIVAAEPFSWLDTYASSSSSSELSPSGSTYVDQF